jgi:coenzyme Q-binding protein COQ10
MPTHAEKKVLPYTPGQLFELVADVARYPEFLPWCIAARVRKRESNVVTADMVIGFKMIRERYTSRITLVDPVSYGEPEVHRIDVNNIEGPFRRLNNHWLFLPHADGCLIDFYVDFEFHSRLLRRVMQPLFNEAVRRMVVAFEARALVLYGDTEMVPVESAPVQSAK